MTLMRALLDAFAYCAAATSAIRIYGFLAIRQDSFWFIVYARVDGENSLFVVL